MCLSTLLEVKSSNSEHRHFPDSKFILDLFFPFFVVSSHLPLNLHCSNRFQPPSPEPPWSLQVVADFGRGELAQSAVRFEAVDYSLEVRNGEKTVVGWGWELNWLVVWNMVNIC